MDIKHKITGETLHTIEDANLRYANLRYANLQDANLRGADLRGANLANASYGEGVPLTKEPIQLHGLQYFILIMDEHMKIGCELHSFKEWSGFDNKEILKMDGKGALNFWSTHRSTLLALTTTRS